MLPQVKVFLCKRAGVSGRVWGVSSHSELQWERVFKRLAPCIVSLARSVSTPPSCEAATVNLRAVYDSETGSSRPATQGSSSPTQVAPKGHRGEGGGGDASCLSQQDVCMKGEINCQAGGGASGSSAWWAEEGKVHCAMYSAAEELITAMRRHFVWAAIDSLAHRPARPHAAPCPAASTSLCESTSLQPVCLPWRVLHRARRCRRPRS